MPNPFRKHSHSRSAKRRGANRLRQPSVSRCGNCREIIRPHRVCASCGYYGGKPVLMVKTPKAEK